jgi:hypothetical protein
MTTNDSPQLDGQNNDNSSMLSGSGRKTLAEVQEAYQTGKAEALIREMNPDQQARFRQVFFRAAAIHARQMLAGDPRYQAAFDWLETMEGWTYNLDTEPDQDGARGLMRVIDFMEDSTVDGPKHVMDHLVSAISMGIFPASKHAAHAIAKSVLYLAPANPEQHPVKAVMVIAIQVMRWHLEVAWAILHDTSIPPLELEP